MMLVLMVFLVLAMVVGAFAGDCVRCSVGLTRGRVTVGGRGGIRMIIVRLVIFVFLDDDNLGRFMLFVLLLLGLFFVSMIIVSLFMEERIIVMRMQGLL